MDAMTKSKNGERREKQKLEVVSRKLEPYPWRTTQREARGDYEQRDTSRKWGRIARAIINYQNKHHGMSPTDQMIALDSGLSPGQVQYHLREMEKAKLIQDNKGWPRRITVKEVAKVKVMDLPTPPKPEKVEEARVTDTNKVFDGPTTTRGTPREREYTKRLPFMERARQLAEAVIDHYDQYGTAPNGKYLKQRVFGRVRDGGGLSRIVNKMVDLGWLHHEPRKQHDYAVTGLGRAALFGQVNERLHTDTPINPFEPPVAPRPTIPRPVATPSISVTEAEIRRAVQEMSKPAKVERLEPTNLGDFEDVDLVIELTNRGFKVHR